jgi:hypothetical protein
MTERTRLSARRGEVGHRRLGHWEQVCDGCLQKPGRGLPEAGRGPGDKSDFWCGIHLFSPWKSKLTTLISLPLMPDPLEG